MESSGSSYRRHFLFSCCLYSDDVSGFLHSSLPNLPLDFIHFCCPNKQQKSFVGLSLFFNFPHTFCVRRKVLKEMEEESLGPPSPPPPPPASSSEKEEARGTTTVRVVSVCMREEEEEEEVENGDDVDDAGEEDVNKIYRTQV